MGVEPLVVYDARLSLGNYRGMGRYLRQLIGGHELEFLGLCAHGEDDSSLRLKAMGPNLYPLWEQTAVPYSLAALNARTYLAPYNTAPLLLPSTVELVLVIHDLIYLENLPASKSIYQNIGRFYRRLFVPRAIRRANHIIAVSQFTADQLHRVFGIPATAIHVLPNTIDEAWYSSPAAPPGNEPYILLVSGEAPSKNLERAIEGFAIFYREASACFHGKRYTLRVAGVSTRFHGKFQSLARRHGVESEISFVPYLKEEELRSVYQRASLLMVPSLAEGFGIPLLEGMASGTPIVASDASCLPEIGGDAVCYFDPYSPASMAGAISRVLSDPSLQAAMISRGREQALRYHPDRVLVVRKQVLKACGMTGDNGKDEGGQTS